MAFYERQALPVPAESLSSFADILSFKVLEDQKRASLGFLLESGFISLLRERKKVLQGEFEEVFANRVQFYEEGLFSDTSAFSQITWDQSWSIASHSYKSVVVEALPTGSMIVHGGLGGSTLLGVRDWRESLSLQIRAVNKAVDSPRLMYVGEFTS